MTISTREAVARAINETYQTHGQRGGLRAAPFRDSTALAMADAAISAHLAALEEAGWVVTPREATEAMCDAGRCEIDFEDRISDRVEKLEAGDCYRAMIKAAPKPGENDADA